MDAIPEKFITLFMDLRFRELLQTYIVIRIIQRIKMYELLKVSKRNTMEIFRNNKWDIMTFLRV
jgi:hypothetical protein